MTASASPPRRRRACARSSRSPGLHVMPCCFDALSARLDRARRLRAHLHERLRGLGRAASARPTPASSPTARWSTRGATSAPRSSIPVIGDADTGYGNALNVRRTVAGYARAGFACAMIEDQLAPKRCGHTRGKQVVGARRGARADPRRGRRARGGRATSSSWRAPTRAAPHGLDEALWRARAFADLGADLVFVEAPQSEAELERVAARGAGAVHGEPRRGRRHAAPPARAARGDGLPDRRLSADAPARRRARHAGGARGAPRAAARPSAASRSPSSARSSASTPTTRSRGATRRRRPDARPPRHSLARFAGAAALGAAVGLVAAPGSAARVDTGQVARIAQDPFSAVLVVGLNGAGSVEIDLGTESTRGRLRARRARVGRGHPARDGRGLRARLHGRPDDPRGGRSRRLRGRRERRDPGRRSGRDRRLGEPGRRPGREPRRRLRRGEQRDRARERRGLRAPRPQRRRRERRRRRRPRRRREPRGARGRRRRGRHGERERRRHGRQRPRLRRHVDRARRGLAPEPRRRRHRDQRRQRGHGDA